MMRIFTINPKLKLVSTKESEKLTKLPMIIQNRKTLLSRTMLLNKAKRFFTCIIKMIPSLPFYFTSVTENSCSIHILPCYGFQCTMAVSACNNHSLQSTHRTNFYASIYSPIFIPNEFEYYFLDKKVQESPQFHLSPIYLFLPPYGSILNS